MHNSQTVGDVEMHSDYKKQPSDNHSLYNRSNMLKKRPFADRNMPEIEIQELESLESNETEQEMKNNSSILSMPNPSFMRKIRSNPNGSLKSTFLIAKTDLNGHN